MVILIKFFFPKFIVQVEPFKKIRKYCFNPYIDFLSLDTWLVSPK